MFTEIAENGFLDVHGTDAVAFLHAQLTSDVAGLAPLHTQYSGYCSPKGRLLATFLVWRLHDRILLELPAELCASVRSRLAKYVLRAKVEIDEVTADYRLFGMWGVPHGALSALVSDLPRDPHHITAGDGIWVTSLPSERVLILATAAEADRVRAALRAQVQEQDQRAWSGVEIEAGVPKIGIATQEQFVPQMVNLDAIGGVSYGKGCYPGQEIVARTRYLGRLKQRMYRIRVPSADAAPGDSLYGERFGRDQASGTVLNVAPAGAGECDALAVIQIVAVDAELHWKSPDGPTVALKPLPYPIAE